MRTKLLAALSASVLVMGGTAASAQVAAPTTATARAGAPVSESSELRGTTQWVLAAIAVGLIIWGAIELFGSDDEDFPTSP
jgi:hypothetical protein